MTEKAHTGRTSRGFAEDTAHAWLQAALEGDLDALDALVREVQYLVYRLAIKMLGHPQDAEDASQEILVLVVTRLATFRQESLLSTWVYRIAVRYLVRYRSHRYFRTPPQLDSLAAELGQPPQAIHPDVLTHAEAKVLEEEVFLGCSQAILMSLEPGLRAAFLLGGVLELSHREAAYALEITPAAFRKRFSRARQQLQDFLHKRCGVFDAQAPCRCLHQINHNVQTGRLTPQALLWSIAPTHDTPEARAEARLALQEVTLLKRTLAMYRAHPQYRTPESLGLQLKRLLHNAPTWLQ